MRKKTLLIFAVAVLAAPTSPQKLSSIPAPDKDPFVGIWKANRDKSHPKLHKRDASYVQTYARQGEDMAFSSAYNVYTVRCDGLFHTVPFGTLSCRYKTPNVVEGETISRIPTPFPWSLFPVNTSDHGYWTREVSADGQEMKILDYKDKAKTKLKSTWVFDRVK